MVVLKFHNYICGQSRVGVETDHKPLVSIFNKILADVPQRLQQMILKLECYNLEVVYVPGKKMFIADTLSRAEFNNPEIDSKLDETLDSLNKIFRVHCNTLTKSMNVTDLNFNRLKKKPQMLKH